MWVRVTNAGGAVGFLPSVTHEMAEPAVATLVEGTARGTVHLVGAMHGDGLAGWVILR